MTSFRVEDYQIEKMFLFDLQTGKPYENIPLVDMLKGKGAGIKLQLHLYIK